MTQEKRQVRWGSGRSRGDDGVRAVECAWRWWSRRRRPAGAGPQETHAGIISVGHLSGGMIVTWLPLWSWQPKGLGMLLSAGSSAIMAPASTCLSSLFGVRIGSPGAELSWLP